MTRPGKRSRFTAMAMSLLAAFLIIGVSPAAAPAAPATRAVKAADPTFPFNWNVNASTHLAKLNQTIVVPQGSFTGQVDLTTKQLTGSITLPPAKTTIKLANLPLATATFQMSQVKPVTGTVDFSTLRITATGVFSIKVVSATPLGLGFPNLVGNSCTTSQPVSVTMSGPASLTGASTFTGTYTIPPLKSCGLATAALNLVVPGPGNTFTAVATPK